MLQTNDSFTLVFSELIVKFLTEEIVIVNGHLFQISFTQILKFFVQPLKDK